MQTPHVEVATPSFPPPSLPVPPLVLPCSVTLALSLCSLPCSLPSPLSEKVMPQKMEYSPAKPGDTFEDLKRKMVGYTAVGYIPPERSLQPRRLSSGEQSRSSAGRSSRRGSGPNLRPPVNAPNTGSNVADANPAPRPDNPLSARPHANRSGSGRSSARGRSDGARLPPVRPLPVRAPVPGRHSVTVVQVKPVCCGIFTDPVPPHPSKGSQACAIL